MNHNIKYFLSILCLAFFSFKKEESLDQGKKNARPNIILINIDDLGWRDVGFLGSDYYETPNIDALSEKGMVFTNGYASASNCAPSRAVLMTGLWAQRHKIYTVANSDRGRSRDRKLIPTKNTVTLASGFTTFPQLLQENGYSTCHAGKWHLTDDPLKNGFDINIGGSHEGHPKSYYPPYKNVDLYAEKGKRLTDIIMDKAIEFVKGSDTPFFLNYSPYAVHTPIQPVMDLRQAELYFGISPFIYSRSMPKTRIETLNLEQGQDSWDDTESGNCTTILRMMKWNCTIWG